MNEEQFKEMKKKLISRLDKEFKEHWDSAKEYNEESNMLSSQLEIGISSGIGVAIEKIKRLRFEK